MIVFSLIIAIGASTGLFRIFLQSKRHDPLPDVGMGILCLAGALAGARAGSVMIHSIFYSLHPDRIFKLWMGGLDGFGGLAGGILFAILFGWVFGEKIWKVLDKITLILLPLGAAAWLGNWYAGVAYGQLLDSGTWWGLVVPDEAGVLSLRVPLQPFAAFTLIALLVLVEGFTARSSPGIRFAWCGLVFSVHSVLFDLMRADPARFIGGLRLDVFLFLIASILFIVLLGLFSFIQRRKRDKIALLPTAPEDSQ